MSVTPLVLPALVLSRPVSVVCLLPARAWWDIPGVPAKALVSSSVLLLRWVPVPVVLVRVPRVPEVLRVCVASRPDLVTCLASYRGGDYFFCPR